MFESILVNATRICEASFANLVLVEGDELRMSAMHGAPAAFEEALRHNPVVPRQSPVGQVIETKQPVHIADIQTVEAYSNLRLAKQGGARTTLGVPMLTDERNSQTRLKPAPLNSAATMTKSTDSASKRFNV